MAFTIDKFRSGALSAGGARANLFEVVISDIDATLMSAAGVKEFTFACKAANIPAMAVGVVEVPYFGRVVKVPGNKTFENWTVTIINDEDFNLRNGFEKWMEGMGTHETNISTVSDGDGSLYGGAKVVHYGKTGESNVLATYNFTNIFPVALGEIALAWDSNDAIEEFTGEFAYDYWTHAGVVTD